MQPTSINIQQSSQAFPTKEITHITIAVSPIIAVWLYTLVTFSTNTTFNPVIASYIFVGTIICVAAIKDQKSIPASFKDLLITECLKNKQ